VRFVMKGGIVYLGDAATERNSVTK
jgi:hypothetical protein